MTGVVGKFFVQFGWSAAIAVFFSLVVARMLTPMMAAYILAQDQGRRARWERSICAWPGWCLKHRVDLDRDRRLLLRRARRFTPLLPTGFMPPDDLSQTQITLRLPPGSTFEQTYAATRRQKR